MKTRTILLALSIIFFAACNRPYDTVFSTYKDGSPKLVFTVIDQKADKVIRIGEKQYYENGKLQYEKHFKDDKPTGIWKYYHDNGQTFASGEFDGNTPDGSNWQLFDRNGNSFYSGDFDSMIVLDYTADHRPLSVAYCKDGEEMHFRFNDNYTVNAKGLVRNGKKEGKWEFFYATGQKMLEAIYNAGLENGSYNSYRENGVPYFLGLYINGKRAGVWEFYDEAGNLAGKQDFDKH